ncbi:MAG: hypothetical protein QOF36_2529 [Microbacteriaceae bacterium]|jgi:hypothetical protein|nr:hypothetical protein [Microbacteriaceae bacterium]
MPPPYYGTDAYNQSKGNWNSFASETIPPQKRGGPLVASGDFRRTAGEWPTIALVDYAFLGIPGDGGIRSVSQEFLDWPNNNFPFFQSGWTMQQGWMVWVRWKFYNGPVMPQHEVQVPWGNQPEGSFLGPDRFKDPNVHTLIFPSGVPLWTYTMQLPSEVDRFTCDMQYVGGPQTHINNFFGFGSFYLSHQIAPEPPPWPYKEPIVVPSPAGTRRYDRNTAVKLARHHLERRQRGSRRVSGNAADPLLFNGQDPNTIIT